MATRSTNLVVPEFVFFDGIRRFQEKVNIFNEASGGAIQLAYDPGFLNANGGDHIEPIRFARPSSVVQHVDEATPAGTLTYATIAQAKGASARQQLVAALEITRDEVSTGKATEADYANAVAEFFADYKLETIRNNLIGAGVAAIDSMDTTDGSTASANIHTLDVDRGLTAGGKVTCTVAYINQLLNKMKDARSKIKTLVMHSSVFYDVFGDSLSNYATSTNVGDMLFFKDVVPLMGRNVMVMDMTQLYSELTSSYYTSYYVLALAEGALRATILKEDPVDTDTVITTNVKSWKYRQDFDVDYAVQGMKWTTAGTNVNPTAAELATAARWDEYYSDHREAGLAKLICNAT